MRLKYFSKKGNALFLILAIIGVLAAITGSVALGTFANLRTVSGESTDDQARFIAQAGVQSALSRLSQPRSWPTAAKPNGEGEVWSSVDYNYDDDHLGLWSSSDPTLHAGVLVYNNTSGAFHRTAQAPDGTDIPEGRILVISSGLVDTDQRGARRSTTVSALVKPAGVLFEDALLGGNKVRVSSSIVDVVDSSAAGWTPASYEPYDIAATPTVEATVASNSDGTDTIEFDTNTQVDGDVYSGPNSTLGAIGYYSGSITTGTDGALASPKDMNILLPPSTATTLAISTFGAGPTTLPGDIYHVTGNLNINNGAELNVTSTTTIYVDGNVNIDGANVNLTGKPWNLQIYLTGAGTVSVTDSTLGALISGPEATFNVSNSHLFGAVIGDNLDVRNSGIHYDRSVDTMYLGSTSWTVDTFLNSATTEKLTVVPPAGGPPADPLTVRPPLPPVIAGPITPGPSTPGPSIPLPSTPDPSTPPASPPTGNPTTTPPPDPVPAPVEPKPSYPKNPRCCLDYSCGPPKCMIY